MSINSSRLQEKLEQKCTKFRDFVRVLNYLTLSWGHLSQRIRKYWKDTKVWFNLTTGSLQMKTLMTVLKKFWPNYKLKKIVNRRKRATRKRDR